MSLHTALVKIEEEKISSEKAKKFISSDKNGAENITKFPIGPEHNIIK